MEILLDMLDSFTIEQFKQILLELFENMNDENPEETKNIIGQLFKRYVLKEEADIDER